MRALAFDTESTDRDPATADLIEAAWGWLDPGPPEGPMDPFLVDVQVQRYQPTRPILPGAMAVHHIIPADVKNCPPSSTFVLPEGEYYLVGHQIDFDWELVGKPPCKRICTLALARSCWPDLDSHTLGAVLYALLPPAEARLLLRDQHSAGADVRVLEIVLRHLCQALRPTSWDHLWRLSEEARLPVYFPFGKYRPTATQRIRLADTPRDYREWCLRQPDMDPYVVEAVRRTLGMESRPVLV